LKIKDLALLHLMEDLKKKHSNSLIEVPSLKDKDALSKKLINELLVENKSLKNKLSTII
jgi:hypothetical protein